MKILLSNDDGYRAPGLAALADALRDIAEITVIAPEENRSAASSSLTIRKTLTVKTTANGMMYVNGTPADCIHLAVNGMLDFEPDMVVSGINAGANLGDDVIYSGTVAAAIEGRFLGLPAIAVSLAGESLRYYNTAGAVVRKMVQMLQAAPLPRDTILNVNVPDVPMADLNGFQATRCGSRHQSQPIIAIDNSQDARQFRIGPEGDKADAGVGTDFYAITQRQISVTPLQIDMTRHAKMSAIASWLAAFKF